jgi:N-acetylmuramoyl-L-alanine amidase
MPLYKTAADKKLAYALNSGVRKTIKIKTRGLRKRTNLKELNKTKAPSCIFETGSIKKDYKILKKKYKVYGKGLAKGLCSYLGVRFKG